MSTYADNRRRQQRLRGTNQKSPVQDRIGAFLNFLAGPVTYNQDVVDARVKAMERGSKIPFLPEFGLSEGFQTYVDRASADLKTAFGDTSPTPDPAPTPQRFDNTVEGQYQRYFKTPEFDNVFGKGARGEGAPKDAAAMEVLGNQLRAPAKDTNIASMYAAQSGMGRVNADAIQAMYSDRPDMQAWARENPMLAQREYLKAEQRRANEMPLAPDNETVMGDLGSRAQMDNPMGQEAYDLIKKRLLNKAAAK